MRRILALLTITGMVVSPAVAQTSSPAIVHPGVACIAQDSYTKIAAQIPSAQSARLYFRATALDVEYYVEMMQDETGAWWAVLPIPEEETESVTYWIVARNAAGADVTMPPYTAPVREGCGVPSMTPGEQTLADNLTVGYTRPGVDEVRGFRCPSVDYHVLVNGKTERHVCRDAAGVPILASGAGPAALTAAEKALIIGGALLTAGAVVVAFDDNEEEDATPVSPVRPRP